MKKQPNQPTIQNRKFSGLNVKSLLKYRKSDIFCNEYIVIYLH